MEELLSVVFIFGAIGFVAFLNLIYQALKPQTKRKVAVKELKDLKNYASQRNQMVILDKLEKIEKYIDNKT